MLNPYQNPGAGNGHGSGHGSGQRNVIGSEQGNAHRQGQSVLNRPYSGLHGGFHYDDAPGHQHQQQQQKQYRQQQQTQHPQQQYLQHQSQQHLPQQHQQQPYAPNRDGNSNLLPSVIPQSQGQLLPAPPAPSGKGFSLANLTKYANLTELKGLVDRMGGLDGILSTVTKVQKVVGSVSQMAPLVKVFMGSFGKKSESGDSGSNNGGFARPKPRKRRAGSARRPAAKRRSRPRRRR